MPENLVVSQAEHIVPHVIGFNEHVRSYWS